MTKKGETMKTSFKLVNLVGLIISVILGGYAFGQGVINVQNGNINHFYQDFSVPGHGYTLTLERSFNSKSNFLGMFGHRWGSNFDVSFKETPEGTVEITEFGGGFKTTFAPKEYSLKDVNSFIDALYQKLPEASKTETLKLSLKNDPKLRHQLAWEHKMVKDIAWNSTLFANDRGPETLQKTKSKVGKTIWVRTFADGKKELFNEKNQLIRREDANKNFLNLEYNKEGLLTKVSDVSGRQILFTYNTAKKVESVTSPLGKKCAFKYDKDSHLIYAKNAAGYEFNYKYNPSTHHMLEVSYPTGQKEAMQYDDEDRITFHEGPEDIKTTYRYDTKGNPDKFFNVIVTKEIGKKPNQATTVDKYDYEFGQRENGTRYTYKLATVLDGVKTETVYTPCCGKPVSINRDGKMTRFEYLPNGLLKNKTSPDGEMVTLFYDNSFNKVSKVVRADPVSKASSATEYQYDKNGNLSFAKSPDKKISVQLFYDTKGRIKQLLDQTGKKISFDYNELGKPTKITQEGTGSIIVSYNAAGEITNVKSTAGRKIAVEVTSAFQSLLDIIRPAGVSLNI
ncbi:MAG TPA: hypothetical protein DD708_07390 [Deltaproteobacteria bacterium]|nr:hypothetical protein [Deltaproteobacteria bacterium]